MLRTVYNMAAWAAGLYFIPRAILRGIFKDSADFEQLGKYQGEKIDNSQKSIWMHCSSVGEVKIVREVIEEIREIDPEKRIVCTLKTRAGKREAHAILDDDIEIRYCPYELGIFIRKAIKHFNPEKLVLVEAELWPALLRVARQQKIKLYLINGRVSETSFQNYKKLGGFLAGLLGGFKYFLMQSQADMDRIVALGAVKNKCQVLDNVKYDIMRKKIALISSKEVRQDLGLKPEDKFIIAGSTRGGEEKTLAEIFLKLKKNHPDLRMIIAPRHIERLTEVEGYLKALNLTYIRRSRIEPEEEQPDYEIMLLDTMGELTSVYSICRAAFVGGSLVPKGGQNPLEPVALGVPTCFGPHTENFAEITATLLDRRLAYRIGNAKELENFFEDVLDGKITSPDPTALFQRFGHSAEISAKKILEG
jgi:3-deoxy-D-manno-octulosonic-acid transferase